MRQAIHIFGKDVRHLWREILILFFSVQALCFLDIMRALRPGDLSPSGGSAGDMARFLVPLAAWILIARVIHAEALPGDRQFWRTRPYEWKSLLGAKALFILVFVNAPMLLADILILLVYGLPVAPNLAGLLWSQLLLTIILVLPALALTSVTVGLPQLMLTILTLGASALAYMMLRRFGPDEFWGPMGWIQSSVSLTIIAVVTLSVVGLQYTRRTTTLARSLAAAGWALAAFVGSLIPWTGAFAIQSKFSKRTIEAASVQVSLDSGRTWMIHASPIEGDRMQVSLPIRVSGVPASTEAKVEGISFRIEAENGDSWSSRQPPPTAVTATQGVVLLRDAVDASFYRKVRMKPVLLPRIRLYDHLRRSAYAQRAFRRSRPGATSRNLFRGQRSKDG